MATALVGLLVASGLAIGSAATASADTQGPIDFEAYALGTVDGQDGWTSTGPFDQAIADNGTLPGAPASFGARSLRISDAVTSGSFGNQTFSKPTVDAAGEATADAGGYPIGTLRTRFTSAFDFASVTPSAEQAGLHISVSPDRGDGARMSYVRIEDTPTGWDLFFVEYEDVAPLGSDGDLDDGCGAGDSFVETEIASDVTRDPHNLQFVMELVDGPHNDVVKVMLDGVEVASGTSWEDYFRYCSESGGGTGGPLADQSRIVRNMLFRSSGTAHPANAGAGFLIDGFVVATADPTLNLTSICEYSGGPYDGQHLWRVTSSYLADKAYTSQSPFNATPVPRTATPGKSWFLGVTNTTKISYSNPSGPQQVTKAANGSTCSGPAVTITTPPDEASYLVGEVVAADFECTGTELVSCVGPVADGAPIDTATEGAETFSVTATAWDGSTATVTNDYSVASPDTGSACTYSPSGITSAQISWYPANPGSMSGLEVACKLRNDTGNDLVSPSFTIHDSEVVSYHNGAAKTVTSSAVAASGATTVQLDPTDLVGLAVAPAQINRVITGPGIAPRTFVTSMTAGGLATLSQATADVVPADTPLLIENSIARSVTDAAETPGVSNQLNSASANFTAADVGLSVSGTGIPANTTISGFTSATQVTISNPLSSEIQNLSLSSTGGPVTGGTFTLSYDPPGAPPVETTGALAFNSSAAAVQTALEGLASIAPGDVVAAGGPLPGVVSLTYGAGLAFQNIELTGSGALLTPAVGSVSTETTQRGGVEPTVSIGGTNLVSTVRQITGATTTGANTITSPTGLGSFVASDIGLQVSGDCNQLTADAGDDTVITARQITATPSQANATVDGAAMGVGWSGCTIVVGHPNGNAPDNGDVIASQGVQLNLNPSLVAGSDECANDQPEGFAITGKWYNPGSFQGTGLTNTQPGPTVTSPGTPATKAVGQIFFDTSAADFSAFVIERKALTPGDPNILVHYDVVFPFAPTSLALCPGSATSPGLSFVLDIEATTASQSALPTGTGRPGTGQVRSVKAQPSGGYTTTVIVDSQGAAAFLPAANFRRTCVYPVGSPNPINFQCGAG